MRLATVILWLMVSTAMALAVQPDEVLKDPALEARARGLSAGLRCLVCQNQSIDESDAPLARDLRILIREQLLQKKSDDEILDFVVARYGDFILLKPPFDLSTLLLWLAPFGVLLAAGTILLRRRAIVDVPDAPLSDTEEKRLKQILAGEADAKKP